MRGRVCLYLVCAGFVLMLVVSARLAAQQQEDVIAEASAHDRECVGKVASTPLKSVVSSPITKSNGVSHGMWSSLTVVVQCLPCDEMCR